MRQKPSLTTSDIDKILCAARKHAEAKGWKVGIAISDDGGHLIGAIRLDGASVVAVESAMGKARTAALLRTPSGMIAEIAKTNPGLLTIPGLTPLQGGVPIMVDGECAGGVGVGGATSEQDEETAAAGIAALG